MFVEPRTEIAPGMAAEPAGSYVAALPVSRTAAGLDEIAGLADDRGRLMGRWVARLATVAQAYGDRSLHEQSHGESFLSLVLHRLGPDGLYVMDEPEAALSPQGCLALLRAMHDLVTAGGQFVVATHSPLLMAYPGAALYELDDDGIRSVAYDELAHVTLYRSFLDAPERFLRALLAD